MFRVQPGESETYPGVDTGDKRRLVGEVDIYWDLWDGGCELFEAEGYRSVCSVASLSKSAGGFFLRKVALASRLERCMNLNRS